MSTNFYQVASTCRVLYTVQPSAAPEWVRAATASAPPSSAHPTSAVHSGDAATGWPDDASLSPTGTERSLVPMAQLKLQLEIHIMQMLLALLIYS